MSKHICDGIVFDSLKLAVMHANHIHAKKGIFVAVEEYKAATMSNEDFAAIAEYATTHGRGWKDRLVQAWLNDWREQWGVLRSIRNNPHYAGHEGMVGIFKTYEKARKARNANKGAAQ